MSSKVFEKTPKNIKKKHCKVGLTNTKYNIIWVQKTHKMQFSVFNKTLLFSVWFPIKEISSKAMQWTSSWERAMMVFPGYLPSPYWSPYWICTQPHTKGHTSNPWNKCSMRGLLTTGGQIPIKKHYRSFRHSFLCISSVNQLIIILWKLHDDEESNVPQV